MLTFNIINETDFVYLGGDPGDTANWSNGHDISFGAQFPTLAGIRRTFFPTRQEIEDYNNRQNEVAEQMKQEREKYGDNNYGIGIDPDIAKYY